MLATAGTRILEVVMVSIALFMWFSFFKGHYKKALWSGLFIVLLSLSMLWGQYVGNSDELARMAKNMLDCVMIWPYD